MRILLVAIALVAVSCTGTGTATSTPPSSAATSPAAGPAATTVPPASATTADVITFLTVVADTLDGTAHEQLVAEDPETVVALGQLFCELRDSGMSDRDALTTYLTELETDGPVTDDDALLVGVAMGAAFETLCPTTD